MESSKALKQKAFFENLTMKDSQLDGKLFLRKRQNPKSNLVFEMIFYQCQIMIFELPILAVGQTQFDRLTVQVCEEVILK